jgi:hypothetical protein
MRGLPASATEGIPDKFKRLIYAVSAIRNSLCRRYRVAELVPGSINEEAFDGIWQDIHPAYELLAGEFKGLEVKIVNLIAEKRKLDETAEDDCDADDESPYKRERFD